MLYPNEMVALQCGLTSSRNVDMLARMSATINTYLKALDGYQATEHSHRPALKALFEAMMPDAQATNEPRRIECGAPDFVIHRKEIPFGYAETKNIGANLDSRDNKKQIDRYCKSLDNVIFTDYLEFRLMREGECIQRVRIGELRGDKIKPLRENFDAFVDLVKHFADYQGCTITTADDLAKHMAHKARMLARVIAAALQADSSRSATNGNDADQDLTGQLQAFRNHLIHNIQPPEFADIYAQTIAYGMFAARLHDPTPRTFTREQAAKLIPKANPFLRNFFQQIAGYNLDDRIVWIVDDLADLFRAADVGELMKDYGRQTARSDPFIHFYETFLGEYDPKKRKSRGVYYTPEPVVEFIVRAVDDILRKQFSLHNGIADDAKVRVQIKDAHGKQQSRELHKVQILDPATGTGTFLAAIVKHISEKYFANQKGVWQNYVKEHLIPRLNGFEVLMASYAMAHIKLDMVLRESGCESVGKRLKVFLTNSLEEHHPDTDTLFARWLSNESKQANAIKRDMPVMVVIGNPPYSGESANKGEWIGDMLDVYKREPGGGKLQEKNSKWINDDYVKFIRYGQHFVDDTGEGILAYITNHGFLDNPTFRGMRWSLLQSFDEIYILDLHGNTKKKETAPDGSVDENVFDIQQGVSINLFVKTGAKKAGALASVFHFDLYGKRAAKYQFLNAHNLKQVKFKKLKMLAPQYYFVAKDYKLNGHYERGFSVDELFPVNGTGIITKRDKLSIHFSEESALQAARDILRMEKSDFYAKYNLPEDVRDWRYAWAKEDIKRFYADREFDADRELVQDISYRPFDSRKIVYTGKTRGFIGWPVMQIMHHFIDGDNIGLVTAKKQSQPGGWHQLFIVNQMSEGHFRVDINYTFPLYLYPEPIPNTLEDRALRDPNLNMRIVNTIADNIGLRFVIEKQQDAKTFAPIDLLDYIYAVLHSPAYREKYIEFLKIDFPRVPYPTDKNQFRKLAKLGGQLRALHLMQTDQPLITEYNHSGDNTVDKVNWQLTDNKLGEVHINKNQRFEKVPATAWEFYIGGYQPAQKWLKDRKGVALTADDIRHWQKIIVALNETAKLMAAIDSL